MGSIADCVYSASMVEHDKLSLLLMWLFFFCFQLLALAWRVVYFHLTLSALFRGDAQVSYAIVIHSRARRGDEEGAGRWLRKMVDAGCSNKLFSHSICWDRLELQSSLD